MSIPIMPVYKVSHTAQTILKKDDIIDTSTKQRGKRQCIAQNGQKDIIWEKEKKMEKGYISSPRQGIVTADGSYSYSYTPCGGSPVGPLSGTGTSGEILQSNVCIESGSASTTNVQANPSGSCSAPTTTTTTTAAPTTTTTTTANMLS